MIYAKLDDSGKFVEFIDEDEKPENCTEILPPIKWLTPEYANWLKFDKEKLTWSVIYDSSSDLSENVVKTNEKLLQSISQLAQTIVTLPANERNSEQTTSMLAEQVVQLTNQNKKLQQALATLAAQVVQSKGEK